MTTVKRAFTNIVNAKNALRLPHRLPTVNSYYLRYTPLPNVTVFVSRRSSTTLLKIHKVSNEKKKVSHQNFSVFVML